MYKICIQPLLDTTSTLHSPPTTVYLPHHGLSGVSCFSPFFARTVQPCGAFGCSSQACSVPVSSFLAPLLPLVLPTTVCSDSQTDARWYLMICSETGCFCSPSPLSGIRLLLGLNSLAAALTPLNQTSRREIDMRTLSNRFKKQSQLRQLTHTWLTAETDDASADSANWNVARQQPLIVAVRKVTGDIYTSCRRVSNYLWVWHHTILTQNYQSIDDTKIRNCE